MRENRQIEKDLQILFSSERGEIVLNDLLDIYVFASNFSSEALRLAFNEGQRELVLYIRSIVQGEIND